MKKTYTVTGMSCANCVANVERAVKKVEGIKKVDVNLIEEMMLVEYMPGNEYTVDLLADVC